MTPHHHHDVDYLIEYGRSRHLRRSTLASIILIAAYLVAAIAVFA